MQHPELVQEIGTPQLALPPLYHTKTDGFIDPGKAGFTPYI
jgi:hypothetical protein